jgi:hypothetical protein
MNTCCFLEIKQGVTRAALLDIQMILKGHSDSEAGDKKETHRHKLNVHEVCFDTPSTGSLGLRSQLQMTQLPFMNDFWIVAFFISMLSPNVYTFPFSLNNRVIIGWGM